MSAFYETVFFKTDSSLEKKLSIAKNNPYYNKEDLHMLEAGVAGEKQVVYHLNKSNVGMYVLRDINIEIEDLKAQIDFIVVTSHHCYFIECKNYNADIIHIDETSNFEISTKHKNQYVKKGIKSPISQVEDQLNVFKKVCLSNQEKVKELLNGIKFNDYFKSLVVFTNPANRLNNKHAPSDIRYRVLKVDNLIRQIEYDDKHYTGNRLQREQMKAIGQFIFDNNKPVVLEETNKPVPVEVKQKENIAINSNSNTASGSNNTKVDNKKPSNAKKIIIIIVIIWLLAIIIDYYLNITASSNLIG